MMRYVFLAYPNEVAWANLSAPERETEVQKFVAFIKEAEQRDVEEYAFLPQLHRRRAGYR
jgi:hypothetical protein